jgi:Predicted membrane-associated Zn-dependent proteases 1
MGPAFFQKRRGETVYSLRAFPIGGFVRLAGMEEEQDGESAPPERTYPSKTPFQRFAILAGGPLFNILLAIVLTTALLAFHGILDVRTATVGSTMSGYPAERIGLSEGDRILSINGKAVTDWESMSSTLRQEAPKGPISLVVDRKGEPRTFFRPGRKGSPTRCPPAGHSAPQRPLFPACSPLSFGWNGLGNDGVHPEGLVDLGIRAATRGIRRPGRNRLDGR